MKTRRFENPGEAAKELFDGFNEWCEILTRHSIQATFAVIAANWAVHGSTESIIDNSLAKWSLGIAIAFLGINLLVAGWMSYLYNKRRKYADEDKERWEKEFQKAGEASKSTPWPYTDFIQGLGSFLRFFKVIVPFIAAILFVLSLF